MPEALEGEAAFAASNGNIAVSDSAVWIVTGGKASRVFYSADRGRNWEVMAAPIVQGGAMTGLFSLDMSDEKHGIAWGGDWENMADNGANKIVTYDGGMHWEPLLQGEGPGYSSSPIPMGRTFGPWEFRASTSLRMAVKRGPLSKIPASTPCDSLPVECVFGSPGKELSPDDRSILDQGLRLAGRQYEMV